MEYGACKVRGEGAGKSLHRLYRVGAGPTGLLLADSSYRVKPIVLLRRSEPHEREVLRSLNRSGGSQLCPGRLRQSTLVLSCSNSPVNRHLWARQLKRSVNQRELN